MRGGFWTEQEEAEDYGLDDLLGEFGARWSIVPATYADGAQLRAEPRPPVLPYIPIVRKTAPQMREALLAEEAAQSGRK